MDTPWGPLVGLQEQVMSSHEKALEILSADKHQLVEGLVVESIFEQIVSRIPECAGQKVIALDVESIVVDTYRKSERWIAFIWARRLGDGLGRYLQALEKKKVVPYLVTWKGGEFLAAETKGGKRVMKDIPLPTLMSELARGRPRQFAVDPSVKDRARQNQAFWGPISSFYGKRLWSHVVLPRILINCCIQPYFRAIWNLDRVFVLGDDIWLFEIKHKYPMEKGGNLSFGINEGELGMLEHLAGAGIRCLHTVLVKPRWSKSLGSMYLTIDRALQERAAVVATVLHKEKIAEIMSRESGSSGAETSIDGKSRMNYKPLAATEFTKLGVLSDRTDDLALRMFETMLGESSSPVSASWLRALKSQ
jgi:hypothetical protein